MQASEFVSRMTALWSKPRETADANKAALEYHDALSRFTEAQLDAGWVALRDSHERASWPLVSEVRKAVMGAASVTGGKSAPPKWNDHSAFADSQMQTPLAVRARSEGWLLSLWDYCKANGKQPSPYDIGRLRREAEEANRIAACLGTTKLDHMLRRIWDAMRDRERKLSGMVTEDTRVHAEG
jgi:hypothetical protein